MKLKVGITHGDYNGVSYEIILKMLADERMLELCTPVIYGSQHAAGYYRKALDLTSVPLNVIDDATEARPDTNNLVNVVGEEPKIDAGQPTEAAGRAAVAALQRAVADLKAGAIDVLVTAPICKATVQGDGFHFPGHTEYLADALGGEDTEPLMILCNDTTRVALVTTHVPMAQLVQHITKEAIGKKLDLFRNSLRRDYAIDEPRIAVLALNPHAGDGGLLGTEEEEIIKPAIAEAQARGIMAFGPYSADGFWGSGAFDKFDGVLAMYHDQGLAPFKTLAMDYGVNYTAGLPYVRTAPDHGTGYDIVNQNVASEASLRQAVYMAIDVYRNRQNYDECRTNPLPKHFIEKPERKMKGPHGPIKSTPAPTK